ncbi:transglutaminase domain-containing protein [Saccharicrinis sp. GN24d3]|uniref:transglutaminase domain-containing protein n=1 Tax=Saccharicrinis sp. GN24d3 TaxID=3458416 RepID=UPI004036189E
MVRYTLLLLLIFVLFCRTSLAQIKFDVKQSVDSLPDKFPSTGNMASIIGLKFQSDEDKAGAIFYWIAKHVEFDSKVYYAKKKKLTYRFRYKTQDEKMRKIQKVNRGIAEEAFRQKRAIAKGFAFLFKKLCNNAGLECETVEGSYKRELKHIGRKAGRANHVWNVVKINKKWYLVDVTLGAGMVDEKQKKFIKYYNETFFMTDPEYFFLNHYPKNRNWLLCDRLKEEFALLPLFYPSYINSDIFLKKPSIGVIAATDGNTVKVVFGQRTKSKNNTSAYSYAFEDDKKAMPIDVSEKSNELILQVPVTGKKYDNLTIYRDKKPLVSFKLKLTSN